MGLVPYATYNIRAYAITDSFVSYGDEKSFKTPKSSNIFTKPLSKIGLNYAQTGGDIPNLDGSATTSERGVCWSQSEYPNINEGRTIDGEGAGSFTSTITGLKKNSVYYVRAYAIVGNEAEYGQQRVLKTYNGIVSDIDGHVYNTTEIGTQNWMADNLKVTRFQNGDSIHLVYSPGIDTYFTWGQLTEPAMTYWVQDSTLFDGKCGALYNGYTIIDSRGLCPTGWHIPTDEDWKTLEMYLGLNAGEAVSVGSRGSIEGIKLKSQEGWYYPFDTLLSIYNESGFTGFPTGQIVDNYFFGGGFGCDICESYYWTSTLDKLEDREYLYYRRLTDDIRSDSDPQLGQIYRNTIGDLGTGYGVRCIKN